MARNGLKILGLFDAASGFSLGMALFASSMTKRAIRSIFWGILMTMRAMGFRFLHSAASFCPKCKAFLVNAFFWSHYLFIRQAFLHASNKAIGFYADLFCKFCSFVRFPFNRYEDGDSSVKLLFATCGPFAIFWKVTKLIIFPFKAIALRPIAHVSNKVSETFATALAPSGADSNSSCAIINKCLVFTAFTSTNHAAPASIQRVRIFKRHISSYGVSLYCATKRIRRAIYA